MSDAYAEGPGDLGGWPEKPTADPRESEAVQKRMEFWKRWFDVVHETPLIKPMFDEAIRGMLHAEYIIVTTQRELAEAMGRVKELEGAAIKGLKAVNDGDYYNDSVFNALRNLVAPTPAPPAKEGESP
jgi:hypothetical protein